MIWQPIETAPKDGTRVLLWGEHWLPAHVAVSWWCLNLPTGKKGGHLDGPLVKDGWTNGLASRLDFEPSHWMPLPEPPEAA